jgi:hypothetical protein
MIVVGTALPPLEAGLPSNHRCVARRSLLLRLSNLSHLHHRAVVQVDVYINGKHVLRERGRRFKNVKLRRLPPGPGTR